MGTQKHATESISLSSERRFSCSASTYTVSIFFVEPPFHFESIRFT